MTVRAPVSLLPLLRPATDADCTPLARVWRRAWCSANPSVASVAPPDHWEARVRAEFGPPCVTLVRAEGPEVTAFLVLDPAQAHAVCEAADPVLAFAALPALWGELAGDCRLVAALREASQQVTRFIEEQKA